MSREDAMLSVFSAHVSILLQDSVQKLYSGSRSLSLVLFQKRFHRLFRLHKPDVSGCYGQDESDFP